jgi:D-alanyl-D-alanine carboxypeptidase
MKTFLRWLEKPSRYFKKFWKNNLISKHKKELLSFINIAFKPSINPAFIVLGLALLLLPGNNYYLDLELTPQEPYIQDIPVEIELPSRYPVRKSDIGDPLIYARSAVVVDVNSSATLYAKNPLEALKPASTTKVMTALVALKHYPLEKIITVKKADRSKGQTMNLLTGERMTVENLLYGLLMQSGNDAAFALAENFDGGYFAYVEEMNKLAEKYHLENTQFRNVSGIDQEGHFTTVRDLARLAAIAMKNPIFSQIVSTREKTVTDIDNLITHRLNNRNELLGIVEGIKGVKTGWTESARECLVTDTERSGNEVITAVLGSNDRFGESQKLIEWTYQAYNWIEPEN